VEKGEENRTLKEDKYIKWDEIKECLEKLFSTKIRTKV